jgi:hypothetical protein
MVILVSLIAPIDSAVRRRCHPAQELNRDIEALELDSYDLNHKADCCIGFGEHVGNLSGVEVDIVP